MRCGFLVVSSHFRATALRPYSLTHSLESHPSPLPSFTFHLLDSDPICPCPYFTTIFTSGKEAQARCAARSSSRMAVWLPTGAFTKLIQIEGDKTELSTGIKRRSETGRDGIDLTGIESNQLGPQGWNYSIKPMGPRLPPSHLICSKLCEGDSTCTK